jgi:TM2 domain-containing membrane protein YozV
MQEPNSTKKPSKSWILFCRLFVCGLGALCIGSAISNYLKQNYQLLSGLIILASIGLLLVCLGIFTSAKTCEKIADGIYL